MSKILTIDIGAGTMDILAYDTESGEHYKAVVKSPLVTIAEAISRSEEDILVTGREMGGGRVSGALKEKARVNTVIMSQAAAATVHHDLEKVRSFGIEVITDRQADALEKEEKYKRLFSGDIETERIRSPC